MGKRASIFVIFFAIFAFASPALIQAAGTYYYDRINIDITVNKDSTFDVSENQTYFLDGNFGYFYRDIELKGLDHITDIQVLDSNGKTVPNPDIAYKGGKLHVQWNFQRENFEQELKSWTVKYKVHGGLGFYSSHDEIYWNAIFQNRDATVEKAVVTVNLPQEAQDIRAKMFIGPKESAKQSYDYGINRNSIVYNGYNIKAGEFLTIVAWWQKGFIQKPLLYKNQAIALSVILISFLIPLFIFIYSYALWRRTGKDARIDKTIIAQYEPFQNMPPALLQVLAKQKSDIRGILAQIIDLSVRGYLRISEKEKGFSIFKHKEYIFEKKREGNDLESFEKKIFDSLFENRSFASSSDLRNKFYKNIPAISKEIYRAAAQTNFFNGNIQEIRKRYGAIWMILIIISGFSLFIPFYLLNPSPIISISVLIIFFSILTSAIIGFIFSYFMPALTKEGAEAKWHMLGFKQYLNTAEKFRIEAETLDTFSKFLPFAMVFGVEKQWMERFSYFTYQQQAWYQPAAVYSGASGMPASFGEFSSALSSFSKTAYGVFSSPGGSGAGGGSAGGGGGGGGGGAG